MKKFEDIHENETAATGGSVNGMGEVSLPSVDGGIGSGDIPGSSGSTGDDKPKKQKPKKQKPAKTITMKKFDKIKEERELNEGEIYIPITDIADPANLIAVLSQELTKRSSAKETQISKALADIEVSYNGLVNPLKLRKLSNVLDEKPKDVKKKLDKLIDKNINLLEDMQLEFVNKLLEDPKSINEGVIGRAIGGAAGFAFGPKVGKLIAKALGIKKGPLYNLLTSRVVSASIAQELTKKLL